MLLNLKTEMERNRFTIDNLADILGVHRNTMANKLSGDTAISFDEAQLLRDRLFPYADLQYLFKNFSEDKRLLKMKEV